MTGRGHSSPPVATTGRRTARDDDQTGTEVTTIIPIDEFADAAPAWESSDDTWDSSSWDRYYQPTRSEITQDILLPESEFDGYEVDEPLDMAGARPDDFSLTSTESGEIPLPLGPDAKPFRTRTDTGVTRRRGKHRISAPPTALQGGRAALVAMAAGAAVAAVAQVGSSDNATTPTPSNAANVGTTGQTPDLGPGLAATTPTKDMSTFTEQLAVGEARAVAEAKREAAARRPLFAAPMLGQYDFTSAFAMRWGSFHGGIDMAAPLGTPIHAVTDGVVVEAGPASGYGNWVQIRADDGTITMYGHMSSSGVLVQQGQRVTAGDTIALVGNEGFSTGPHLHFEVWKDGTTKIDPAPWLAQHGITLSGYTGG